jgi:dTDP-4-amino-4,6-dideoxygalactose transaminase
MTRSPSSKSTPADLAKLGGKPLYDKPVHVGQPNIGDQDLFNKYVDEIFKSRWLTNNGPFVQKFEKKIEELLSVRNCIAMCNGTIALELCIRALGIKGEVIVPSFTFIATAHALYSEGATPIFCDINPETHIVDQQSIEKALSRNTSAIVGVHLWGHICDHEAINEIATKHNLNIIYDAAHAFLCSRNGIMVGNKGNAEVLSFHATKFLNSFEGGAVVTNDDELAEKLRLMRNFGFSGRDKVIHHGTNGKMSEISAAMGLVSLASVDKFIDVNRRNYLHYCRYLESINGIKVIKYNEGERNNYQYIVLEIDEDVFGLSRDALLDIMSHENILARRYFYPGCHNMEPYKTLYSVSDNKLPLTTEICRKVLVLPTGTAISESDIEKICGLISFVATQSDKISTMP